MREIKTLVAVVIIIIGVCASFLGVTYQYSSPPEIGTGYEGAYTASVTRVGQIQKADFPPDKKFYVPAFWEVELQAARASGDKDTKTWFDDDGRAHPEIVGDQLRDGWPRWQCNVGQFLPPQGNVGTNVVWRAPEATDNQGQGIQLFEDDVAPPVVPPDTGSTDDGGSDPELGANPRQDLITIVVLPLEIELHIRNMVGQTKLQTTNSTPAPNSRGKLGLWWTTSPDWLRYNGLPAVEKYYNGGTQYLGSHQFAVGTALKTEMYAVVMDKRDFIEGFRSQVENNDNWRFMQERKGGLYLNGVPSPDPGKYSADWVPDGAPKDHGSPEAECDMKNTRRNGHLYYGDAPGIKEVSGGTDGDILSVVTYLRTWVQFKCLGVWQDVLEKPDEPNWGVCAELRRISGSWIVTVEAAPAQ